MQTELAHKHLSVSFLVLPMIFMPNPTALYLCSQLASVTKGLRKPLPPANRFLPTSEATAAAAAAPASPPGVHHNTPPRRISSPCFTGRFQTGRAEKLRRRSSERAGGSVSRWPTAPSLHLHALTTGGAKEAKYPQIHIHYIYTHIFICFTYF